MAECDKHFLEYCRVLQLHNVFLMEGRIQIFLPFGTLREQEQQEQNLLWVL